MIHDLGGATSAELADGVALVLVPVGSTEQHGPHLPLDTDTRVATAVAVATQAGGVHSEVDVCEVTFAPLDPTLIARYVASGAPLDKAGAYGIQDLLGAAAIERIHGSYYTVMGLPTHCVYRMLTAVGPRG